MGNLITLLTDFGTRDGYVGAIKGVIFSLNPAAQIVEITHDILPQDVQQAAFVLGNVYRYFPADTIHLAVVDPGVGTSRLPIVLATPEAIVIAPDNGLISYVLADLTPTVATNCGNGPFSLTPVKTAVPNSGAAIEINDNQYWLPAVSSTFHGRDIFAPVAAHLSLGVPVERVGKPLDSLFAFSHVRPRRADNAIIASVIHVDSFGNLITNLRQEDLPSKHIALTIAGQRVEKISHTYAETTGLAAIIGGFGFLEIALKNSNAAHFLQVGVGEEVRIETL